MMTPIELMLLGIANGQHKPLAEPRDARCSIAGGCKWAPPNAMVQFCQGPLGRCEMLRPNGAGNRLAEGQSG